MGLAAKEALRCTIVTGPGAEEAAVAAEQGSREVTDQKAEVLLLQELCIRNLHGIPRDLRTLITALLVVAFSFLPLQDQAVNIRAPVVSTLDIPNTRPQLQPIPDEPLRSVTEDDNKDEEKKEEADVTGMEMEVDTREEDMGCSSSLGVVGLQGMVDHPDHRKVFLVQLP